jgi:hypothetical protein
MLLIVLVRFVTRESVLQLERFDGISRLGATNTNKKPKKEIGRDAMRLTSI